MRSSGTISAPDGTAVAWRAEGEGTPLVFCNGLANDSFQWGTVLARLVTWDFPGHGESEPARTPSAVEIPTLAETLGMVADAAAGEGERIVLLGYSLGCQLVLESWRTLSERIAAMVCVLGTPGKPFETFLGNRWLGKLSHGMVKATPPAALRVALRVPRALGPIAHASSKVSGVTERGVSYRDFAHFYDHLVTMDPASFRAMSLAAQRHTAEDLLPTITVPTLVVAGGTDVFTPPERARAVAGAIPGSEQVFLPGASHAGLVGHGDEIAVAIATFLDRKGFLVQAS